VSACVSLSWSDGLCRDTAKLSDELRSSGMSGQDVKGRLFGCLFMVVVSSNRLAYNVLALGAVADFEAQSFHLTTKVDAR